MRPIHTLSALACLSLLAACESPQASSTGSPEPKASSAPAPVAPKATAPPAEPGAIPAPADVGAAPADAQKTRLRPRHQGRSRPARARTTPAPEDTVKVHYTGWTKDGKMFDSSVARGEPTSFRLNQVIKGWTEGLQLMVVGEKRRLWIPARSRTAITRGAWARPTGDLVFDVELLDITPAPKPPPVPDGREGAARRPRRRRRPGSRTGCSRRAPARTLPKATDQRHGELLGLDDGRQDVRQLGHARPAGDASRLNQRHQGLDRGRAAHGRRRQDALLDPGQARLRRQADAPGRARRACSSSTSSSSASAEPRYLGALSDDCRSIISVRRLGLRRGARRRTAASPRRPPSRAARRPPRRSASWRPPGRSPPCGSR